MDKNSFLMYLDYEEQFNLLTDEQVGRLIRAIYQYEKTREIPQLEGMLKMAFSFIKTQLDKDRQKYADRCEKNRENGARGGRPKKQEDIFETEKANGFEESEGINQKPKKADNDNEDEEDNDSKKENIKKSYGENGNVKFTDEEYEKVKAYFPNDYTERIQGLDDYIQSKGKRYKDFFATLKTWARKDGYKPPSTSEPKKEIEIDTGQLTQEEYMKLVKGENHV